MGTARTVVRLASRNTARKRTRTLLTAGMVALGVALLTLSLAWLEGALGQMLAGATDTAGHVRLVHTDFAKREALMPLYANIPDIAPLQEALAQQPGVLAVMPRLRAGVTVTVGEEIGDVFALAVGAPTQYLDARLGARDVLVDGGWFTGAEDELVMGSWVAGEAGAKVGDEVVLLGLTQDGSMSPMKGRLVGICHSGSPMIDRAVLVPLPKLQHLTDIVGGATELLVYGRDYEDAVSLAASVRRLPQAKGLTVQAWSEREPWAAAMGMINAVWGVLILVIVFLTSLGIWNTMMMSVLERTHEIGVLRGMGLTTPGVIALFVYEALVIAVGGGVVGLVLGGVPAALLAKYGIHLGEELTGKMGTDMPISSTIYAELTVEILAMAFALGLVMAVLGSALPAVRAAIIQPVSAMRSGR